MLNERKHLSLGQIGYYEAKAAIYKGKLGKRYGPEYTQKALANLADEMSDDLKEIAGVGGYARPERREAVEKHEAWLRSQQKSGSTKRKPMPGSSRSIEIVPEVKPHKTIFEDILVQTLTIGNPWLRHIMPSRKSITEFSVVVDETNIDQNIRTTSTNQEIRVRVSIQDRSSPISQEEFLHGAQDFSTKISQSLESADSKLYETSTSVVHSSILLDMVLSAAAVEMGPTEFLYWSNRAREVTKQTKEQLLPNKFSGWERTLLGKAVNRRFNYPISAPELIGIKATWLTKELESLLLNSEGNSDKDGESMWELICLQYGTIHRDLTFSMLEEAVYPSSGQIDYETVGRKLIEWGKRVLKYYKGRPEESELVTHHSQLSKQIGRQYFEHEISDYLFERIQREANLDGIPTEAINLSSLAGEAWSNTISKVKLFIAQYCQDFPNTNFEMIPDRVLTQYGLNREILKKALVVSKTKYKSQQQRSQQFFLGELKEAVPEFIRPIVSRR